MRKKEEKIIESGCFVQLDPCESSEISRVGEKNYKTINLVALIDFIRLNQLNLVEIRKKEKKSNQVILFELIRLNHLNLVEIEKKERN